MQKVTLKCKALVVMLLVINSLYSQTHIMIESDKRPLIEVSINGVKRSMLIDTGSSLNIVDTNQLLDLGIKKRFKMASAYSIFGKATMWHLLEIRVSLGNIEIYQFTATDLEPIVQSIEHNTGIKIAGILGTPAIKELGMVIDLNKGIITIK